MKTELFDYYLPEELIAQTPLEKRDAVACLRRFGGRNPSQALLSD